MRPLLLLPSLVSEQLGISGIETQSCAVVLRTLASDGVVAKQALAISTSSRALSISLI